MADEARAMLDALMGNNRNDYIPNISTARHDVAINNEKSNTTNKANTSVSCYDRDVCPYYTAWGVDVFELFVNTKSASDVNSHLGIRPPNRKCSDDAHKEFTNLPLEEMEQLGYERMLHAKLKGLVASANRTVARNKEKLRQEIARNKKSQAANSSAAVHQTVHSVNAEQLEVAADLQAKLADLEEEIEVLVKELKETQELLQQQKEKEQENEKQLECKSECKSEMKDDDADVQEEAKENSNEGKEEKTPDEPSSTTDDDANILSIKETKLIESIMHKIMEVAPLKEQIASVKRSLYYIRADFQTDKTVCEVSGNFMSSRDADERIAAHYAGKQYVGWKMVREKCKELDEKYRNLPPLKPRGAGGYDRHPRGRSPDFHRGYHHDSYSYDSSRRGSANGRYTQTRYNDDRGYNGHSNRGGGNYSRGGRDRDRDRGYGSRDQHRGRRW
mmetsp:Transcript_15403/g.23867  ORF Transcript_15403/g.23867 Transcript_15403/m.23867 type:complete len:446 (-) Transcript_15403:2145-3482(-)|eukprot:CAMPEP_0196825644 /NCGR_PEP_ID=MMETSP1362-20130617/93178_1 /TAXON_ID=163516 /ORGANISM="Leptocylindrus danicus, Strain CCMP1856" /LENGTH=445 /DNA_ID=CAMNT_0042206111 /DNA_START=29 /DNA_END=1366 /DNA_ORIENTATION=+